MHTHQPHEARASKVLRRRRVEAEEPVGTSPPQHDGLDLCSVLRSIPPDAVGLVWNYLDPPERRALRATCKELRLLCSQCIHATTAVMSGTGPARAQLVQCEQQLLCFPRLQKLELRRCDKSRTNPCRLFMTATLRLTWANLQELKLHGGTTPIKLPRAFNKLQVLTLTSLELDVGSLSNLVHVPTLKSLLLKQVSFRRSAVVNELGSIRSITTLELDDCSCHGFFLDMMALGGLDQLQTMDLTHMDKMTGSGLWRSTLGAALSPLTSLRSVRLDASEYGVVVETEEQLPIDTQLAYNQALRPITALQNLESLAMDFLLTDDGWRAASQLPNLRELIVEGVVLTEPMPGIMTRLEELTLNKVTPAQLMKLLPLPALRRLHIIFVNVTANSLAELDEVTSTLQRCSELLMAPLTPQPQQQQQPVHQAQGQVPLGSGMHSGAAQPAVTQQQHGSQVEAGGQHAPHQPGAASTSGQGGQQLVQQQQQAAGLVAVPLVQAGHPPVLLPAAIAAQQAVIPVTGLGQGTLTGEQVQALIQQSQPPQPPAYNFDIWAGLQLVAENSLDNANEPVMFMSKQIGSGRLARSLQPVAPILRTLCLQCMAVTCSDVDTILDSLPHLMDLVFMSCSLEPLVLQHMHRVDRSFYRLSLLYGCSWITAAQVSSFCIAASSSRILAAAGGIPLSPVLELEISSDSMSWDEQVEVQRVLNPYSNMLSRGRVRLLFVVDRDLSSAVAAVGGDGEVQAGGPGPNAPGAVVIGAQEPLPQPPVA